MKEQLISFETAKLAKEKGFNIPQINFYNGRGILGGLSNESYQAPTQSLLENWLLIKHNINIELTFDDAQWLIYVGEFSFPDSSVELAGYFECNNFKEAKSKKLEALEIGLQKALNLITK